MNFWPCLSQPVRRWRPFAFCSKQPEIQSQSMIFSFFFRLKICRKEEEKCVLVLKKKTIPEGAAVGIYACLCFHTLRLNHDDNEMITRRQGDGLSHGVSARLLHGSA